DAGRVYWGDLSGAAAGCLLSIAALELLGGAAAVLAIAAVFSLAGVVFALGAGVNRVMRRVTLAGLAVLVLLAGLQIVRPWLTITRGGSEQGVAYERWSANAHVPVYEPVNYPFFWSISPQQWERTIAEGGTFPHALLLIDKIAGT